MSTQRLNETFVTTRTAIRSQKSSSLEQPLMQAHSSLAVQKPRRQSSRMEVCRAFGIAALLLTWGQAASAVDFDLNTNGQNWATGTTWLPNGVPVAGNSVQIDQGVIHDIAQAPAHPVGQFGAVRQKRGHDSQ